MSDFEPPTDYKSAILPSYINKLDAHHKLYISLGIAILVYTTTIGSLSTSMHLMLSWLSYSLTSIALAWTTILTSHPAEVKQEAHAQDSSRKLVSLFVVAAAFASLFAVIMLLKTTGNQSKQNEIIAILTTLSCVVSSWWLVHTVFTLRYAHYFYCDIDHDHKGKKVKPGGLSFPNEDAPDYLDFTYFSFVIGMTFQVSDVEITSRRIRRLAWMHGVLSFAFNTIIVAFSINMISSLIQK
jgi:uncharacterized membrane protein